MAPDADIRATWEQKTVFQIAPTSVFGFNAATDVGAFGSLNFLGLFQNEKALVRRPQLGVESKAVALGGVNGQFEIGASWLDRFLDKIPGLYYSGTSAIRMNGELAASLPNPNTQGDVYIDDFDGIANLPLSVLSTSWKLGSVPGRRDGAGGVPKTSTYDIVLEWRGPKPPILLGNATLHSAAEEHQERMAGLLDLQAAP